MLTQEKLKRLLHYDPETGVFTWRISRGRVAAGYVAGRHRPDGYATIKTNKHDYLVHRLAWLYMMGDWPVAEIDHKNGNPSDNRWSNIREATRTQNLHNKSKQRNNKSGIKGVFWDSHRNRWVAKLKRPDGSEYSGRFNTKAAAAHAYAVKARQFFGEFARAA